uniref:RING-type E3 ubiquitin transferase n=1 Tax=Liriodendron tulipifera TaxID=3415 RepID=E5DD00_LIRTU|nr:VARIANT IN METHYLATION-like protein [Liriodendron tulipifera]
MAHDSDLPCDGDGICMLCKKSPSDEEKLLCNTCATPWHVPCLSSPPQSLSSTLQWNCPDCSPAPSVDSKPAPSVAGSLSNDLISAVRAIEADESLNDEEKARRRQELMSGGARSSGDGDEKKREKGGNGGVLDLLDGSLNCSFCMQLPERPVTTPCGHNFCLKCFQKWVAQGKRTCAKCRHTIPTKMASQPRINSALVVAIRMARTEKSATSGATLKPLPFVHNQNRPDKAFTTERAKRAGKANACSGKIFVTVPPDHFGPIPAENDPERNQGVLVGESWEDRMECRQWGAHLPHVAGIAGQSDYGAQSVALSGGYEDDEDHGEWFLYTGSGGRDLSGNRRTNKEQSFDQKFEKLNEALRVSCKKGYPVRVVRSHKEKRSSYAPETGVRYDGIYRIEKCWRKVGVQGFKVCRYLFVRCDNEPAPWTSDEHGDRPRPLPGIKELKNTTDVTERKEKPAWDYEVCEGHGWKWTKPPPMSRRSSDTGNPEDRKRGRKSTTQGLSVRDRLLKGFSCLLCHKVMTLPLTTPCAHNFCKPCLEGAFAGRAFVRERTRVGGRSLRAQKNVMKCPSCPTDISDFLQNPQVNRELMDVIESLKRKSEENVEGSNEEECEGTGEKKSDNADEDTSEGTDEKKSDDADEDTEVGSENPEMAEGGSDEEVAIVQVQVLPKRKKTENSTDGKKAKKSKKSSTAEEAGDDSPSSPLHVRSSDDDDFE